MMKSTAFAAIALLATGARAQPLKPALSGLSFMVGEWSSVAGRVADTGGTSTGMSTIATTAGGAVLLRRDHTNLFAAGGHATGGFDQLMTIYAEDGAIHADYFDLTHVIHYTSAAVEPGHSVIFSTTPPSGARAFRLTYTLSAPDTLAISFAMAPPPGTRFHEIAAGAMKKIEAQ